MEHRRDVLSMTDEEFEAYIKRVGESVGALSANKNDVHEALRTIYGNPTDRAWMIIRELSRHGLADTTSYGKPILRKGIGAFAETVSTLAPGIEIRRIVNMLIMQALTDFIVASEAYGDAVREDWY